MSGYKALNLESLGRSLTYITTFKKPKKQVCQVLTNQNL